MVSAGKAAGFSAGLAWLWAFGHLCLTHILSGDTCEDGAVEFADLAVAARCVSQDREFRIQAESAKRIVWDTERRCFLDAAAVAV